MAGRRRVRIRLRGIVQGVGFRPFVYNLARGLGLGGYVLNSSAGLVAEVEGGPRRGRRASCKRSREQPPPLAWISSARPKSSRRRRGRRCSSSARSDRATGEFALVSPDVATCDDCLADFSDPADRRYGYPFTNCTNCGPRYTIIRDIPYDRPKTTMARFPMCPACQAEYDDPRDRRFHAQPNACPVCGPRALGGRIDGGAPRRLAGAVRSSPSRAWAAFTWRATPPTTRPWRRLRERKRRSDKPFALMARDLAAAEALCDVSEADRAALYRRRGGPSSCCRGGWLGARCRKPSRPATAPWA